MIFISGIAELEHTYSWASTPASFVLMNRTHAIYSRKNLANM
jgi:hypothetical protein